MGYEFQVELLRRDQVLLFSVEVSLYYRLLRVSAVIVKSTMRVYNLPLTLITLILKDFNCYLIFSFKMSVAAVCQM